MRILLAATGLTPQVVTETLFCLATAPEPDRFVPDEIHVVTTLRGKDLIDALFVKTEANQLLELCGQYGIQEPRVRVHVIQSKMGPLDDVRTAQDNDATADSILRVVRQLTSSTDSAVHFSIAGGRKTMGYYLGTCASILGRPQDRMSHVLVNEPFESTAEFFFPPHPARYMLVRGRPVHTSLARVALADVGFVRLRPLLPRPLIDRGSFTQLVGVMDGVLGRPHLMLRLLPPHAGKQTRGCEVEIGGGMKFSLQPKSFAMYWLLARQASRSSPWVQQEMDAEVVRRDFLEVYEALAGLGRADEEVGQFSRTPGVFLRTDYQNAMSRLVANLKKELGEAAARVYGPRSEGSGTRLRHRLDLLPEAIHFEDRTSE